MLISVLSVNRIAAYKYVCSIDQTHFGFATSLAKTLFEISFRLTDSWMIRLISSLNVGWSSINFDK